MATQAEIAVLRGTAAQVKNESQVGGNTAGRVGGLFEGIVDALPSDEVIDGKITQAVADIQPIVIEGDVDNAPDQEDLTSVNQGGTDVLKFKDKTYSPALFSGLGRVYLRKNIVTLEGTGKNVLTQAMVNTANTIYLIQYDYDLNGQTITMPAGCVLEFDGGSVKNGNIVFAETLLMGDIKFSAVNASGMIANEFVSPRWFGAQGDGTTNDSKAFKCACNVCDEIRVDDGDYVVDSPLIEQTSADGIFLLRSNMKLLMSDGCTLHCSDNLPQEEAGNKIRAIIVVSGSYRNFYYDVEKIENVIVKGGKIIGCRQYFTIAQTPPANDTKENYVGIHVRFADGVTIDGMKISDCAGDCILNYGADTTIVKNCHISRCRRGGINYGSGSGSKVLGCTFSEIGTYIEYPNGNSSYGLSTYCHDIGLEMDYWGKQNDVYIKDIEISGNTFNMSGEKYGFLGYGEDVTISDNIFVNVKTNTTTCINPSNGTDKNNAALKPANFSIVGNTFANDENEDYSTADAYLAFVLGYAQGDNHIENNKATGRSLTYISTGNFVIKGNHTGGCAVGYSFEKSVGNVQLNNNYHDGTEFFLIRGAAAFTSTKTLEVSGNIVTAANNERVSTSNALFKGMDCFGIIRICNNLFTLVREKIFDVPVSYAGSFKIVGNTFNINRTLAYIFGYSGGATIVQCDMCYNTFNSAESNPFRVLVETNFTGHANVVGNVFDNSVYKRIMDKRGSTAKVNNVNNVCKSDISSQPNGTTANRPTLESGEKGYVYYDTTLGKPIWWNGTAWVDATGTAV